MIDQQPHTQQHCINLIGLTCIALRSAFDMLDVPLLGSKISHAFELVS